MNKYCEKYGHTWSSIEVTPPVTSTMNFMCIRCLEQRAEELIKPTIDNTSINIPLSVTTLQAFFTGVESYE